MDKTKRRSMSYRVSRFQAVQSIATECVRLREAGDTRPLCVVFAAAHRGALRGELAYVSYSFPLEFDRYDTSMGLTDAAALCKESARRNAFYRDVCAAVGRLMFA